MMIDPTMSDREQHGLRGPVKSCTRESTRPGVTDADGKTYPEVHLEYTTEYDTDGRVLVTRSRNSDGSQWVTRFAYDTSGRTDGGAHRAKKRDWGTLTRSAAHPAGAFDGGAARVRDHETGARGLAGQGEDGPGDAVWLDGADDGGRADPGKR